MNFEVFSTEAEAASTRFMLSASDYTVLSTPGTTKGTNTST